MEQKGIGNGEWGVGKRKTIYPQIAQITPILSFTAEDA
jgi:hypothetical protein